MAWLLNSLDRGVANLLGDTPEREAAEKQRPRRNLKTPNQDVPNKGANASQPPSDDKAPAAAAATTSDDSSVGPPSPTAPVEDSMQSDTGAQFYASSAAEKLLEEATPTTVERPLAATPSEDSRDSTAAPPQVLMHSSPRSDEGGVAASRGRERSPMRVLMRGGRAFQI